MKVGKVKVLLQVILYAVVMFAIQIAVIVSLSFLAGFQLMLQAEGDFDATEAKITNIFSDGNMGMIVSLLIFEIVLVIFAIWYSQSIKKEKKKYLVKNAMTARNVSLAVAIGIFAQPITSAVMMLVYVLLPNAYQSYTEMIESAIGANVSPLLIFLSVVVFAPIAEELLFRGMIFRVLRKEYRFQTAAIISSLIFAVYHMNIVQGIYCFLFAWLECVLYERTKTFWYTVIVHAAFNASTFGWSWFAEQMKDDAFILGGIMIVLWILSAGIVLAAVRNVSKNNELKSEEILEDAYI